MFEVGKKVICVNAESANSDVDGQKPASSGLVFKDGEVYMVEKILDHPEVGVSLNLTEMNEPYSWVEAKDFRPLDYDFVEKVLKKVRPKEEYSV